MAAGPTALARPWNMETASAASWLATLAASWALTSAMRCAASALMAPAILAVSTGGLAWLQAAGEATASADIGARARGSGRAGVGGFDAQPRLGGGEHGLEARILAERVKVRIGLGVVQIGSRH